MYFPGEDDDIESDSDSSDEDFSDEDEFYDEEDIAAKDTKYNEIIQGGDVYSTGYGYFGQLGHNSTLSLSIPRKVPELKNIVQVSCGESHSIAVAGNGEVFSWGCNRYGQLGLGDTRDRCAPQLITSMGSIKIAESACGTFHSVLVTRTGEVYTFGCGSAGRLGHGDSKYLQLPKVVTTLRGKRITQIACGAWFTVCVSNAGAAYSWGFNRFGQLGIGKNPPAQNFPRHITALYGKPIVKVACGKQHTALLTDEGECYTFGLGVCGQLGHKNKVNQSQPKMVEAFTKRVVDVACGSLHTLALTHDGKLYIWGYVSNDHLGLSEGDEYHSTPLHVITSHLENRVVKVSAGAWHSAILTNKGEMYTWGLSHRGRLGLGYPEDFDNEILVNPTVPTHVETFKKKFVLNNALGGAHTLAIVLELEPEQKDAKTETTVRV